MWFWILAACLVIGFLLWCTLARSAQTDDYEDQMRAIKEWERKHKKG